MYRVTSPLVLAVGYDGKTHHRYSGELVEVADPAIADYLLGQGMIEPLSLSTGGQPELGSPAVAVSSDRPLFTAPKAQWVNFAVSQGFDRTEAEALPKAKLIEALQ